MSIVSQTLAHPAVATFIATVSAGSFLALVAHVLAISREIRAELRKREAEKRTHGETGKTNPGDPWSVALGSVVTTGVQQNGQGNTFIVNQQIIMWLRRDDEHDLSP
jgi:hypothetical protein